VLDMKEWGRGFSEIGGIAANGGSDVSMRKVPYLRFIDPRLVFGTNRIRSIYGLDINGV
jgi:hypothetical protein